jgi:N4-gp56 family major capsid protein
MNDYNVSGMQRYGVPDELGTSTQSMTVSQDRSFTFTVDRKSDQDQVMTTEAGRALRRQIDEIVIPEVDIYRLAALVAGAGNTGTGALTSGEGAYDAFLEGVATILGNKAPLAGTFAFISPNYYRQIRLDSAFILNSDLGQETRFSGQVGRAEGIPMILTPFNYLPTGVEFVITNRIAAVGVQKLSDFKLHDNPPGINGWLAEGRIRHDLFVLNNKANAIYVHTS